VWLSSSPSAYACVTSLWASGAGYQMTDYEAIILEREGHIATIRLNRPDKHNAINSVMSREMIDALDALEADDDIRVIILTGAGDKAF